MLFHVLYYFCLVDSSSIQKGERATMGAATMTEEEREYTLDEVSAILRLKRNAIVARIKQGKLKARQEGREWRIRPSDLEAYRRSTQYNPNNPDK